VEQREELRAGLVEVALADGWDAAGAVGLVDVALRRWLSFERRQSGRRSREQHLLRGLKERFGDDLYLEPGWLEHVSARFAGYLVTAHGSD
jgi:hypothetical protein